jgi:hypothetical protein
MQKKLFLGLGIFFSASTVIGFSSATYYYHVNSPYMYYNVKPTNQPIATTTSQAIRSQYSRPIGTQYTGPIDVRHKYIVPRIELKASRVITPIALKTQETQKNVQPTINGRITKNQIGDKIVFTVDPSSFENNNLVQWKWHYNSHAIHCNENVEGDLICIEVNPHIASEVWAEFFIPQTYEITSSSNKINLHSTIDVIKTVSSVEVNNGPEESNYKTKNIREIIHPEPMVQNTVVENYYIDLTGYCTEYDLYDNRCDL